MKDKELNAKIENLETNQICFDKRISLLETRIQKEDDTLTNKELVLEVKYLCHRIDKLEMFMFNVKNKNEKKTKKPEDIVFLLNLMEKYEMLVNLFLDEGDNERLDKIWEKYKKNEEDKQE